LLRVADGFAKFVTLKMLKFCPELEIHRFIDPETPGQNQIELPEDGAVEGVAFEVAERSGRRDGERGRVDEIAVVVEIERPAGQIRAPVVASGCR